MLQSTAEASAGVERQTMAADVVCVGFGPAAGGFLTTLSRYVMHEDGTPRLESRLSPGIPLQVIGFERADDIGFGVSGAVTRAQGIRRSFPDLDIAAIPLAARVDDERLVYLLDPIGASRRSGALARADRIIRALRRVLPFDREAVTLPVVPSFLRKRGGLVLSIGQFNQWVGTSLVAAGAAQLWPSSPVAGPLFEDDRIVGVRLVDQETDRAGRPRAGYMPGLDVRAALTVVADGPVGPVGQQIDDRYGLPAGRQRREWAVGMKVVVDLPAHAGLEPGTVLHTFGYPEPEIFGFLYVHAGGVASLGIFVPSWFRSPLPASYRYLQHWMLHPYLWRHLEGGTLRSWGAKSLQESGRRGEPFLAGHGYARIGEGSGSTNALTGSGVDEAWTTGVQLAEAVVELLETGKPFTREYLEATYVRRRRDGDVEAGARRAENARNGFHRGLITGLTGMVLAGLSGGRLSLAAPRGGTRSTPIPVESYFANRIPADEVARIRSECVARSASLHDALMTRAGWPPIPFDGRLLISHQDALLLGGKVRAPAGYADHVVFVHPELCQTCQTRTCVEICSGEAITVGPAGAPQFDRDKCVHCGACSWGCVVEPGDRPGRTNVDFRAGAGGLHSGEN
jgi:electron-transferring-flavoprotein dehydrogenase